MRLLIVPICFYCQRKKILTILLNNGRYCFTVYQLTNIFHNFLLVPRLKGNVHLLKCVLPAITTHCIMKLAGGLNVK